jgi:hypothetical protein
VTARRRSTRLDFCCYCLLVLVRNASWFSWLEEGRPAANRRCQSPAEGCPCAFGSQESMGAVRRSGGGPGGGRGHQAPGRARRTLTVWGWKSKSDDEGLKDLYMLDSPQARGRQDGRPPGASERWMLRLPGRRPGRGSRRRLEPHLVDADPRPLEWYYYTSETDLRGPAYTITNQY